MPYAQPPRAGWGRFWLGVLTGGCVVLVLEAIVAVVLLLVIGTAINSAVQRATGGGGAGGLPGLPGGLPVPSGLPGLSQRSDPCSPQPCMAHRGLTVLIANVNRNAGAAADGRSHLVRLDVTFLSTSGTHSVTPEEIAIRDSTGQLTLAGADQGAATCGEAAVSEDVGVGQKAGPHTVCYAVGGSASAPLTVVWVNPEDLSVVELKLP
jgi:hypothetical protein